VARFPRQVAFCYTPAVRKISLLLILVALLAILAGCTRTRKPVEGEKVLRHTVQLDETLEEIADDYYGDPKRARDIARFNEISGDTPVPGTVLRVPMTPEEMEHLHRREQARAPYNEGLDLAARGSYLEAAEQFERAIALDAGFAEAWYNLALTHQRMGLRDRCIDEFRRAVKLRADNNEYLYALGAAYFWSERYREAIASFTRVLARNPEHRNAQFSLARAYEKTGENKRAREAWERYLELDSTSEWADVARDRLEKLQ